MDGYRTFISQYEHHTIPTTICLGPGIEEIDRETFTSFLPLPFHPGHPLVKVLASYRGFPPVVDSRYRGFPPGYREDTLIGTSLPAAPG